MFAKGLFTNIVLIAISVGIFLTYLRPTFTLIEADQDSIAQYETERSKIQSVNARLNQLASAADQLSRDDRDRLYTYLPNEVDTVAVQRDLLLIAEMVGIELTTLSVSGEEQLEVAPVLDESGEVEMERSKLVPHHFDLAFIASYEDIKEFLSLLEQNHYPLQVSALSISGVSEESVEEVGVIPIGSLNAALTVTTYSLTMQEDAY